MCLLYPVRCKVAVFQKTTTKKRCSEHSFYSMSRVGCYMNLKKAEAEILYLKAAASKRNEITK